MTQYTLPIGAGGSNRRTFLKGAGSAVAAAVLSPLELAAKTIRPLSDEIVNHIQDALQATIYGISPKAYASVSQNHYGQAVSMAREAAKGKSWENGQIYQSLEVVALMHDAHIHRELASLNIVDPKGRRIVISGLPDIYIPIQISSPYRVNNLLKALQNYQRVVQIHAEASANGRTLPKQVYADRLATNGIVATLEMVYEGMINTLNKLDAETDGKHSTVIKKEKNKIEQGLNKLRQPHPRARA